MYDDLVTRLREEAECPDNYPEDSNLMREAADAIEILQTLSDEQSRIIAEMGAKYQEAAAAIEELSAVCKKQEIELVELTGEVASKPRWIPVTERLPECDLGAEVGNIEWISCGMVHSGCFGRGGKYRDAYFRTWTDAGEGMDAKDADYWRQIQIPEPPKEET